MFFEDLIQRFKEIFINLHNTNFTNQSVLSCTDIYNLCVDKNPDRVIEIGTNYGASTISLAKAMNDLKKPLDSILTFDLSHEYWKRSLSLFSDIMKRENLDISQIKYVSKDFNILNPEEIITCDKTLIFYDIHDHRGPWSQKLIENWVPLLNGTVIVHDITEVNEHFEITDNEKSKRSKALHFSGKYFAGFNECNRIISWANENKIDLGIINGGIYFDTN